MLRLWLSLMCSAICALFLLGIVLDKLANQAAPVATFEEQLFQRLILQLTNTANQTTPAALPAVIAENSQHWQLQFSLEAVSNLALPAELRAELSQEAGLTLSADDHQYVLKALTAHPDWLLKIQLPAESQHHPDDLWLTLSLYGGICMIMLFWLMPLTRRLWLLSQTAQRFGAGELTARLPPSRWSYTPTLEQNFNQMADQITQLLADNQMLASSLSHDMRTPLACFRFGLEAAQESQQLAQKDLYLQRLEQDLDRMEAMVNAFLEYASLSRQQQQLSYTELDLQSCCRQVVQQCQPLLQQKLQLSVLLPPAAIWLRHANAHWLQRALMNMLHNACRYAHQQIELSLQLHADEVWISISDDGPGIAPADCERIFQPFVRLEAATAPPGQPQFGLGLAIVQRVASWHQGRICVSRSALGGACFSLQLPLQ
jgi:signal transduction histidine kinase